MVHRGERRTETSTGSLVAARHFKPLPPLDAGHAVQQGRPFRLSSASAGENARETRLTCLLDAALPPVDCAFCPTLTKASFPRLHGLGDGLRPQLTAGRGRPLPAGAVSVSWLPQFCWVDTMQLKRSCSALIFTTNNEFMINVDMAEIVKTSISFLALLLSIFGIIYTVRLSRIQKRISGLSVTANYLKDLRTWASEAIEICHQVTHQLKLLEDENDPSSKELLLNESYRDLSIIIDKGRFFLPNKHIEGYGNEKPSAYQGFRHASLDPLVAIAQIIRNEINLENFGFKNRSEPTHYLTREFISEIQTILKTEYFNQHYIEIWNLSQESKKQSQTSLQINTENDKNPTGVKGIMEIIAARKTLFRQKDL